MDRSWKECYLNVPLNKRGEQEYSQTRTSWSNVYTGVITWDEFDLLIDVFNEWNDKFDLLIDVFEDDALPADKTREAMAILERYMTKRKDVPAFVSAASKLKEALQKAIEARTPLFLDF
ncbi:MAG: hypothetical protein IJM30_01730 [Thermoguttaceae bacterium]|nr:hypothetical protein [Thermoguttaceae bacterium]